MKKEYIANQCCLFRAKMKNFIGVFLFSLAVLLNCIELSLSADNAENHNNHSNHRLYIFEANSRARLPYVHYYSNQYGDIIQVTELSELPDRLALVDDFIIGVVINDRIYPIYNRRRQQVLARSHTGRHVVMTQELGQHYNHYFRRPFPQHPSSTTPTELQHHPANWRLGLP